MGRGGAGGGTGSLTAGVDLAASSSSPGVEARGGAMDGAGTRKSLAPAQPPSVVAASSSQIGPRIARHRSGRRTIMAVPRPGSDFASIVPSWSCTMRYTTESPMPLPPTLLV